jgi:hypothetical protein
MQTPGSLQSLIKYFKRLNVTDDRLDSYIAVLEVLNINSEQELKDESNIQLLIAIARGSAYHARTVHRLYPEMMSEKFDYMEMKRLSTVEETPDSIILESLRAIVAASDTNRYYKVVADSPCHFSNVA